MAASEIRWTSYIDGKGNRRWGGSVDDTGYRYRIVNDYRNNCIYFDVFDASAPGINEPILAKNFLQIDLAKQWCQNHIDKEWEKANPPIPMTVAELENIMKKYKIKAVKNIDGWNIWYRDYDSKFNVYNESIESAVIECVRRIEKENEKQ